MRSGVTIWNADAERSDATVWDVKAVRLCKMRTCRGVTYMERGRGVDEVYGVQGVVRRDKRV